MQKNWRLKFGVGFMLFSMTVVAGYYFGLNRGDQVRISNTVTTRTYSLASILSANQPAEEQYEAIETLIQKTIAPDSWGETGGMSIMIYPAMQSLVINQRGIEHEKIGELLDTLSQHVNEEFSSVKYDLSAIVDTEAEKSASEQMKIVCAIAADRFSGVGNPEMELVCDPEGLVVTARTSGRMHNELTTYFESLREAREMISAIDHH